jgi:hypothetical protein
LDGDVAGICGCFAIEQRTDIYERLVAQVNLSATYRNEVGDIDFGSQMNSSRSACLCPSARVPRHKFGGSVSAGPQVS